MGNVKFGVTSLTVHDTELKQRRMTADIHIFSAANGFAVIYFDDKNIQKARIFDDMSELLKFVGKKLTSKGE